MDAATITTPLAALIAGAIASIHCTGMCGPLTCAAFGNRGGWRAMVGYQFSRLLAYSLVGGVLGAVGGQAAAIFSSSTVRVLPWAFAILFLLFAFRLEKRIPQPRFLARWFFRWRLAAMKPTAFGAALGFLTPLIPCGPLYLVFGVALMAGSFVNGAVMMASFAAGTIPLFFLVQTQFARLPVSPRLFQRVQQGLALISALLLIWRGVNGGGGLEAPFSCCH